MPFLSREPLTMEALKKTVPSAFKDHAWPGASNRYEVFNTSKLVKEFGQYGWLPVQAGEKKARLEEKKGFQTHLIRLGNPDTKIAKNVGNLFPEIVITNSHDGVSSLKLHAGFFRLVCSNGLIVPAKQLSGGTFRHYHSAREMVEQFVPALAKYMDKFNLGVYEKVSLDRKKQVEFAKTGLMLRGLDKDEIKLVDVDEVLRPVRVDDEGDGAWNVYNRIQENLMKGNYFVTKLDADGDERIRKARPLNDIKLTTNFNVGLWNKLEELVA